MNGHVRNAKHFQERASENGDMTMSRQGELKQAHEFGCLRAAQECLLGFPQGEIQPGDDPPDCYVVTTDSGRIAFELTEQVDRVASRAAALAKRFIEGRSGSVLPQTPRTPHGVDDIGVSR